MNGHLKLEGDETREELREACLYLWDHWESECRLPRYGTPIEDMIPDVKALILVRPNRAKGREIVDLDIGESL